MEPMHRLLHRPCSATRNTRPVADVVTAAAAHVGDTDVASILEALRAQKVLWAWQLEHAEAEDWKDFGPMATGLKLAIRAELANPTLQQPTEMNERLRRFLLLPEPDGSPARRLNSISAMFCGLLVVSQGDQQSLAIVACEILCLIAGLFVSMPLGLLRPHTAVIAVEQGWSLAPAREDIMDAIAALATFSIGLAAFLAAGTGLAISTGGWRPPAHFYYPVTVVAGACWCLYLGFGMVPTMILLVWQAFCNAASPYPLIGALVVYLSLQTIFNAVVFWFILKCAERALSKLPAACHKFSFCAS